MLFRRSRYFPGSLTIYGTLLLFVVLLIFFNIKEGSENRTYKLFKFKEDKIYKVQRITKSEVDTLVYIMKYKDKYNNIKRKKAIYDFYSDSIICYFDANNSFLKCYSKSIPFSAFISDDNNYNEYSLFSRYNIDQWQDKSGLISQITGNDTLTFMNEIIDVFVFERFLSTDKRQKLTSFNDDRIFNIYRDYYSEKYGWVKTITENSTIYKVIEIDTLDFFGE
ncbi:MAG: hypothetical protein JXR48_03060 [Candidatus Delongbacteria bacterium]|nr:hypothetical protein [Candidatus Delongbacteria bacterium]MBN2833928.1 hypothetical protein [Candidatus Delongbacteria bacterium]